MTFNWGHKLILVFLLFGSGMSFLVYRSVKTNYDLVSKEYYKDELGYQQVIDGTVNANKLATRTTIVARDTAVVIILPAEMKGKNLKGTIHFYCPTDARRDKKIDLQRSSAGEQIISGHPLIPGRYIVKINWTTGGLPYYSELDFTHH
jgi:hypothetical protein